MTGGTFMNFDVFEKKAKELGVLGIVVTKDGKEIGKKLWDEQCRRNVYSASKSFTSTAVGIAVKEGLLSLDEKLVDCEAAVNLPTKYGNSKRPSDHVSRTGKSRTDGCTASGL